jgi:hypothetical protein
LVVEVVVLLDALPFESAAEFVVVESVLTFLPLSLVSVLVVVLESVVDCSAFWANIAVAVKSATKMNFFIRSSIILARTSQESWLSYMKRPPWGLRYAKFDAYAEAGAFGSVGLGAGVEGAWGLSGSRLFNFGLQSM